ncbi:MAG: hypothetical protein FWE27_00160 [Defluviitaleaceae bacterium]|nr:hypothetical protein [Defluviitaleaceae bacterium]
MNNHEIISQTSAAIIKMIKAALVPKIIRNEGDIGLSSEISELNHELSVVMYNIVTLNPKFYETGNENDLVIGLEYMIAAESKEDAGTRPLMEQNIMGAVLSLFNDNNILILPAQELPIVMTLNNISIEDKARMELKCPALYYLASPIVINAKKEIAPPIR